MKTRKGIDDDHLTYLDAGRIAQESGCAAIALHGRTVVQALLRRGRLGRDRAPGRARRHPGARQRRHLGGRRRAADGRADRRRRCRGRPGLPGPAVAVPRPRRRLRRASEVRRRCRALGEVAAMMRRHAELLCRAHGGGARLQGVPQARVVVPQGLPRRRRRCAATWRWSARWPSSTRCSPGSTPTSRSRSPSWARRAVARASPASAVALPEGWLDDTDGTGARLREDAAETTGG